jgi:hypothetical protein
MAAVVALHSQEVLRARHRAEWTKHLFLTLRSALGAWHDDGNNGWTELEKHLSEQPLHLRSATLGVWRRLTEVIEDLGAAGGDVAITVAITDAIAGRRRAVSRACLFDELGRFANELLGVIHDAEDAPDSDRKPTE